MPGETKEAQEALLKKAKEMPVPHFEGAKLYQLPDGEFFLFRRDLAAYVGNQKRNFTFPLDLMMRPHAPVVVEARFEMQCEMM